MQKTVVIRLPATLLPPSRLGRERFVRDALANESNDEGTAAEKRTLAGELYTANEALYQVFENDPSLFQRLMIAQAGDKMRTVLDQLGSFEGVSHVLHEAVEALPADSEARHFFAKANGIDVLLEEYAAPVMASVQFTGQVTAAVEEETAP